MINIPPYSQKDLKRGGVPPVWVGTIHIIIYGFVGGFPSVLGHLGYYIPLQIHQIDCKWLIHHIFGRQEVKGRRFKSGSPVILGPHYKLASRRPGLSQAFWNISSFQTQHIRRGKNRNIIRPANNGTCMTCTSILKRYPCMCPGALLSLQMQWVPWKGTGISTACT